MVSSTLTETETRAPLKQAASAEIKFLPMARLQYKHDSRKKDTVLDLRAYWQSQVCQRSKVQNVQVLVRIFEVTSVCFY
jgi:hypothetical protein